jgi:hypothetical protein
MHTDLERHLLYGGVMTTAHAAKARYEAQGGPDTLDMLMTLPYIMVPRNKLPDMLRGAKAKAEATEQRHVQESFQAIDV